MRAPWHPCWPDCQGWDIFDVDGVLEIQRCDECWQDDPDPLFDEDYCADPVCLAELREQQAAQPSLNECAPDCTECVGCDGAR